MNWEAIGTIAEIVGAAGVIASLLYLAIQIRQSTKVARAETTKDLYLASRDAILQIASNDELAKIWARIRQFESEDIGRQYAFYQSFFRLYELQYHLAEQGIARLRYCPVIHTNHPHVRPNRFLRSHTGARHAVSLMTSLPPMWIGRSTIFRRRH